MCEWMSSSFHDIRLEYADSFAMAAIARGKEELILRGVSYTIGERKQAANRVKMT